MKKFLIKIKNYRKPFISIINFLRILDVLFANKKNIEELNQNLKKRNSFKQAFLRGLVAGIARAIGATIIAAIIIAFLAKFFSAVNLPFVDNILEKANINTSSSDKI